MFYNKFNGKTCCIVFMFMHPVTCNEKKGGKKEQYSKYFTIVM